MENTREKNKRADGRKKTYFDRENKKKAVRTEKTKSVAPEKGKQKKSSSSSKCPYQKKCGGCTYLNLSYEEQLAKKEQFSTIVVISGWSLRRAFTKLFFDGKTGDTQTRTTMISPEAKPVRTMTWRRRP